MKLIYLGLLLAPVALAGHWSACVVPGGNRRDDATSYCCSKQGGNWSLNGSYHDCRSTITADNGLDSGKFADRCSDEYNLGSVGE